MQITISVKVNKSRLEQLLKELKPKADAILDKSAFDIEMTQKSLALVDTGAMRASVYVEGSTSSGSYGAAASEARGLARARGRSKIAIRSLPKVGELERLIGPSVTYAIFVESRYKPFVAPSVEAHKDAFLNAWYTYL